MNPLSYGQHPQYAMPIGSFPIYSKVGEVGIVIQVPVIHPKAETGGGGGYGGGIIYEGDVQWQFTRAGREFILKDDDEFIQLIIAMIKAGVFD